MKCKIKGKKSEVALKIDISNAYDRVDWRYLKGLCIKWDSVKSGENGYIAMCMEYIHYSILLNACHCEQTYSMREYNVV